MADYLASLERMLDLEPRAHLPRPRTADRRPEGEAARVHRPPARARAPDHRGRARRREHRRRDGRADLRRHAARALARGGSVGALAPAQARARAARRAQPRSRGRGTLGAGVSDAELLARLASPNRAELRRACDEAQPRIASEPALRDGCASCCARPSRSPASPPRSCCSTPSGRACGSCPRCSSRSSCPTAICAGRRRRCWRRSGGCRAEVLPVLLADARGCARRRCAGA